MAYCKFCGGPVVCAEVHHAACWEREAEKAIGVFCDGYCHWPFVCKDEGELEEHCDSCPVVKLVNLGV